MDDQEHFQPSLRDPTNMHAGTTPWIHFHQDRMKAAGLAGRLAIGAYSHNVLVRGRMDRGPYGPWPF